MISSLSLAGYVAVVFTWHPHQHTKFDLLGWLLCALFVTGALGLAAGKPWARWMSLGLTIFFVCIVCLASIGVLFFSAFAAPAKDLVYFLLVLLSPQARRLLLKYLVSPASIRMIHTVPYNWSIQNAQSPVL
ncbi:MAG: hypothetical protein WBR29_09550 [Gammaproteobacteria bacterium]